MKYLITLSLLVLFGCTDKYFQDRDFPVLLTLDPCDIDSTGATLRAELVFDEQFNSDSYGFLWGAKESDIGTYNRIQVGELISEKKFQVRIDTLFSKGRTYFIKSYATFGGRTVYGNTVSVESRGCENCYWEKVLTNVTLSGAGLPAGISGKKNGIVVFNDGQTYSYNPKKNMFEGISKFPIEKTYWWNTGIIRFLPNSNYQHSYVIETIDGYIYEIIDGEWYPISIQPGWSYTGFERPIHFFYDDIITILYRSQYNKYFIHDDKWEKGYHSGIDFIVGGCSYGENAYLMFEDRSIHEYSLNSNQTHYLTTGPDRRSNYEVSFAYMNKIFFGSIFNGPVENSEYRWIQQILWYYDLNSSQWTKVPEFQPEPSILGVYFHFLVENQLYIGIKKTVLQGGHIPTYDLYMLDLEKLPY